MIVMVLVSLLAAPLVAYIAWQVLTLLAALWLLLTGGGGCGDG